MPTLVIFAAVSQPSTHSARPCGLNLFSAEAGSTFVKEWKFIMIRNLRSFFSFIMAAPIAMLATLQAHGATIQAASCQQSAVNAVINGPNHVAVNGDSIQIPAGTCTWTSGVKIPAGIGISILGSGSPNSTAGTMGAGTSSTIIVDDIPSSSDPKEVFVAAPTYGNATMRVSTLVIEPQSGATPYSPLAFWSTCTSSGCPNIRVDNITFPSSWYGDSSLQDAALLLANNSWGVLDHNSVTGVDGGGYLGFANFSDGNWFGVGQYGDNSWAQPDTFGTQEAIYLENNYFSTNVLPVDCDTSDSFEDTGGCRYVARFNTNYDESTIGGYVNHGAETGGRMRSGRQMEVYDNSSTCVVTSSGCDSATAFRGGAAYVFDNTLTAQGSSFYNAYLTLSAYRRYRGPSTPWGMCDGTGPYDQNDGKVYGSGTVLIPGTLTFGISATLWGLNQWAGSAVTNGTPYSVHDVTQGIGAAISSNTATLFTFQNGPTSITGDSPLTWNIGDSYQIERATVCIDAPGRGAGNYISGTTPTPTGWVNEALDPVYEWGDTHTGSMGSPVVQGRTEDLIANRDYYFQVSASANSSPASPFNGTSGTGYGTLANRPTTCTSGVAYWATDQGNWNQSGSGGQGELFKCTATNTWALSYTPYTYPHPLTGGASQPAPPPPTQLTGVAVAQ
jgi:hypothetical protein